MATSDAPKVWRDYTQEELDYNYDQRALVTNWDDYIAYYTSESDRVRAKLHGRLDVSYGPSEDQILDVFPAAAADSPVVVYIHGGAWTRSHKDPYAYVAEPLVDAGIACVSVHFGLVPKVTLDEQVGHNRAAIEWTWRNCRDFGADPDRLYVAGHSSGGHPASSKDCSPAAASTIWRHHVEATEAIIWALTMTPSRSSAPYAISLIVTSPSSSDTAAVSTRNSEGSPSSMRQRGARRATRSKSSTCPV
jgi:arylformamidase